MRIGQKRIRMSAYWIVFIFLFLFFSELLLLLPFLSMSCSNHARSDAIDLEYCHIVFHFVWFLGKAILESTYILWLQRASSNPIWKFHTIFICAVAALTRHIALRFANGQSQCFDRVNAHILCSKSKQTQWWWTKSITCRYHTFVVMKQIIATFSSLLWRHPDSLIRNSQINRTIRIWTEEDEDEKEYASEG